MHRLVLVVLLVTFLSLHPSYGEEQAGSAAGAQLVQAQGQEGEVLSTSERLDALEKKIDLLIKRLGEISGRTTIGDFLEREFADIDKRLSDIERDLSRVQSDVRRLQSKR